MARPEVAVVGGGDWGLALAGAAARTGGTTVLLSRRASARSSEGAALPEGVSLARDESDVGRRARLVLLAVPSGVARSVCRSLGEHLDGRHFVVHGIRGLVAAEQRGEVSPELETIAQIVRDETAVRRVGALGGPALASDLLAGRAGVMVCGSHYPEVNRAVIQAFASPALRLVATEDLLGLEWASALVGCLAIAVGFARGVGLGPGLLAAVITRAIEEAAALAAVAGGDERTLLGLAGYGDLLASIEQTERPEVLVGAALARGVTLDRALAEARQRVEAVEVAARVVAWAEAHGVRAPIFGALAGDILKGRGSRELVERLMTGAA
jgi:glycerol-3-phosphate dehydrogenase (NAD(P)+)